MTKLTPLTCVLCLCTALYANADTYRWTDANGVVNYSERKPKGIPAEMITTLSEPKARSRSASAEPVAAVNTVATPVTNQQDQLSDEQKEMLRGLERAEAERQVEMAKIRADNCERSKKVLDGLTVRNQVRMRNKDGTVTIMREEDRQEKIAQAQRNIAENCTS